MLRKYKKIQASERQERWSKCNEKLVEIKPNLEIEQTINLQRKDQVFLTRQRIRHSLTTHRYIFDRSPMPGCVACHVTLKAIVW